MGRAGPAPLWSWDFICRPANKIHPTIAVSRFSASLSALPACFSSFLADPSVSSYPGHPASRFFSSLLSRFSMQEKDASSQGFLPHFQHFATQAIHVGQEPEQWTSRAVVPLISLSTTFKQAAPGQHSVSWVCLGLSTVGREKKDGLWIWKACK